MLNLIRDCGKIMNCKQRRTIFHIFPVLVFLFYSIGSAANPVTTRVSFDANGNGGNNSSYSPVISADGRYTAFRSDASNLVVGDTNGTSDIFVHDRLDGKITRVSVDSNGNESVGYYWGYANIHPSISADGRFVAFASYASNLVAGDTNDACDVFVHDRQTGSTTRVSVDSNGVEGNGYSESSTSISADGRYVAFASGASNLVAGDTNGVMDVFVHDRQTGSTTRVSVDSLGIEGNGYSGWSDIASRSLSISADGRYVAFLSDASNLVSNDNNISWDVFVHDRQTESITRVSVDSSGTEANAQSVNLSLSADGRFVAFTTDASNLVMNDTNSTLDVFVHDRQTGGTTRVSVDSLGIEGNSSSYSASISADGRYVAFTSVASNLVSGDNQYLTDAFIHDRLTGQTSMVSVDSGGNPIVIDGCGGTLYDAISADGRYVAFSSCHSSLTLEGYTPYSDIFVRGPLFDPNEVIQQRPEQTIDDNINGTGRKAVVITHGWNSDVNVWAVDMANKICGKIGGAVPTITPLDGYKNRAPLYCSTADWDVFLVDWSSTAFAPTPKDARSAAGERGKAIGQALAEKNYDHIHFLAHSAGSQLIDTAKNVLLLHKPSPDLHLTFFDAYDPDNYKASNGMFLSNYGYGASRVDNYVDMRSLIVNFENSTKNLMPAGYNVDVTFWDDRIWDGTYVSAEAGHAWPIDFYKQFTFSPMTTKMGFQLSQESGNDMTLSWFNTQKKECILPFNNAGTAPYCAGNKTIPDIGIATGVNYGIQRNVSVSQVVNSSTGSVTLPTTILDPTRTTILNNAEYWSFNTGSPVWSKMDIDVKQSVNALTFDYEFLSAAGAEGYVSVFVDDAAVGYIDERLEDSSGVHTSDRLYIGELAAGKHTLAVRVDPYTTVQSSVKLSNLKLVYVNRDLQTFPWAMFLPAITHKVQ